MRDKANYRAANTRAQASTSDPFSGLRRAENRSRRRDAILTARREYPACPVTTTATVSDEWISIHVNGIHVSALERRAVVSNGLQSILWHAY